MILTCSVHVLTTVVDVLQGLCALDCTRGHVEAIVEWRGAGRAGGRIDRRVPPQTGSSGARDCNSFLRHFSACDVRDTGFLFGVREAVVAVVQKI